MNKIALAGNPNSGKTTIFNLLCGTREKIGNWPGTTVERKEGYFNWKGQKIKVVDLPGIYGLSAYSEDERIARDFLIKENPDLVVCIIDSSNLERNLYLVIQLLELGKEVLLVLNMMDITLKNRIQIYTEKLSEFLKVNIVKTIASRGIGIDELREKIIETLLHPRRPQPLKVYYKDLESIIEDIESYINKTVFSFSSRAFAIRILEGDVELLENLKEENLSLFKKIKSKIDSLSENFSEDLETFIIERRYDYIKEIVSKCSQKESEGIFWNFSDSLDRIFLNKYLGFPIFFIFMYILFQLVFTLGNPIAEMIDNIFSLTTEFIKDFCKENNFPHWFSSLLTEGIISGIGSVLVFLPNIMLLFLGISILEDSGYLARAAFLMDRVMHSIGLHGKSFIPLLLGFGCNIPGIMATRTLESRKDRIITILVNPLMSCSARLPVYTLFTSIFFPKYQGLVVFSLYFLGIVLAIIVAKFFQHIFFRYEISSLVMELPPYRIPTLRNVLISMWTRSFLFIKKAGTIILFAVILIWILSFFPVGCEYGSENSLIGKFGNMISPILSPAGFGFWQAGVALFFGILAKEVVVGTFGTLFGTQDLNGVLPNYFSPLSAYAFLIMTLVYIPCIASIATMKKETNWKWTLIGVSYSLILGWILSVVVYQIGRFFI